MTRDRLVAIVNPVAGGGRCGRRAARELPKLQADGVAIDVRETRRPGDATRIARNAWTEGARRFVAVGGDGTAFEVLNGILPAARQSRVAPILGILPLGTGNSFVRDFADDGAAYSIEAIRRGERRSCDVLHVRHADGELYALGTVSLAFPADVAALVNRRLKPFGRLGYSLGVLACVAGLSPLQLHLGLDGHRPAPLETVLFCLQNNRYVGGNMLMAPEAAIDDGRADLVIAGKVGRWELLKTFPRIFKGTHASHPAVTIRQVRRVEFESSPELDVMIDGESMRLALKSAELEPAAIEVLL